MREQPVIALQHEIVLHLAGKAQTLFFCGRLVEFQQLAQYLSHIDARQPPIAGLLHT